MPDTPTHAALCLGEGKASCTCGAIDPAAVTATIDRTIRERDEAREERDRLEEWSNTIASRMGDNFDGEEGQEWIIDRWLDLVEERLREIDPPWHRYLFLSGPEPDPRNDEEDDAPSAVTPPAGPLPWRPL
jgi:hypothetical protein